MKEHNMLFMYKGSPILISHSWLKDGVDRYIVSTQYHYRMTRAVQDVK